MLTERERRELREIERYLAVDTRLADAMRCQRLPRDHAHIPGWTVALIGIPLIAAVVCAVLGSIFGAVICAAGTVAVLGLAVWLPTRHGRTDP
jgi:hypothetical protein